MVDDRRRTPRGATVIVHGSDATDHAEEYLRNGADYVLVGEAERTLCELCEQLLQRNEPGTVTAWLVSTRSLRNCAALRRCREPVHGQTCPNRREILSMPPLTVTRGGMPTATSR